ncbi:hypothetical protein F4779DRAFT_61669 [Xylariaceae sp. FL0662B]|nr:hypothetical protein F4779DRAFT_61669 [Xylariaceae sp. FL0662B]
MTVPSRDQVPLCPDGISQLKHMAALTDLDVAHPEGFLGIVKHWIQTGKIWANTEEDYHHIGETGQSSGNVGRPDDQASQSVEWHFGARTPGQTFDQHMQNTTQANDALRGSASSLSGYMGAHLPRGHIPGYAPSEPPHESASTTQHDTPMSFHLPPALTSAHRALPARTRSQSANPTDSTAPNAAFTQLYWGWEQANGRLTREFSSKNFVYLWHAASRALRAVGYTIAPSSDEVAGLLAAEEPSPEFERWPTLGDNRADRLGGEGGGETAEAEQEKAAVEQQATVDLAMMNRLTQDSNEEIASELGATAAYQSHHIPTHSGTWDSRREDGEDVSGPSNDGLYSNPNPPQPINQPFRRLPPTMLLARPHSPAPSPSSMTG